MADPTRIRQLHREAPLTDLHAHPSLKAYLLGTDLAERQRPDPRFQPFRCRTNLPALEAGGVGLLWASHYVPERQLFEQFPPLGWAARLRSPVAEWLGDGHPWRRLADVRDIFAHACDASEGRLTVVRSAAALERARAAGRVAAVETVEGAHVLEGELGRVGELAASGVVMITLAHLYDNDVARSVDAFPDYPWLRPLVRFRAPASSGPALTPFGEAVVRAMVRHRVLIDLCHMQPAGRERVFALVGSDAPLVASHVGVRALHDHPYNLSDDEIRAIAASGGVVGVIMMPWWLTGGGAMGGLEAVWRTLEHVREVTGGWEHVALGSDFDGFTEPPDALPHAGRWGALTERLLDRGVAEEDVRRLLGGNARRLLDWVWDR